MKCKIYHQKLLNFQENACPEVRTCMKHVTGNKLSSTFPIGRKTTDTAFTPLADSYLL